MDKTTRERIKASAKKMAETSQASTNFQPTEFIAYFEMPQGKNLWIPKSNEKGVKHYIDIIPFPVGDKFPDRWCSNPADIPRPGDYWHVLDLHIHRSIGTGNASVVCPKWTFWNGIAKGDKAGCPICEDLPRAQANAVDEEHRKAIWRELKAQRRTMYCVMVYDGAEEEDKGVQAFEVAHYFIQRHLDEKSKSNERRPGTIDYMNVDGGKTIVFTIAKSGTGKDTRIEYTGHDFVDRVVDGQPYDISDDVLEQTFMLESTLTLREYDEISEMYYGKAKGVEPQNEAFPERGSRSRGVRGQAAQSQEEERPSQGEPEKTGSRRRTVREPEETGDVKGTSTCPAGFRFGYDCLEMAECEKCPNTVYTQCSNERRRIDQEKRSSRD